MLKKILIILVIASFFSCSKESQREKEIEKIPVSFKVVRFDQKFADVNEQTLPALKAEYPFLFPKRYPDSVWVNKIHDTIQQALNKAVTKAYPEFSEEENDLQSLFQHIKYYFPDFTPPTVITITSDVDYKHKVLLSNDYLFIALDTYLGKEHPFYIGIQQYLKKNFKKDQILPDVATEIAKKYVPEPKEKTFLSHMLYYGKILYLKDRWLPETPDYLKIGYTKEELDWAKSNEEQIWRYFVEKEVIFDSDTELYSRFLYPAPFSKFHLMLDNESPDRIGQYIG
ncbi:MAG: gliding motility lipoprotein GldB, partial [Gillisia sp.]